MVTNTYEVTAFAKDGKIRTKHIVYADSEYEARDSFKQSFGVEPIHIQKVIPPPVKEREHSRD